MPQRLRFPLSAMTSDTAGSVMFLLGIGELLEEWTHKEISRRPGKKHVLKH